MPLHHWPNPRVPWRSFHNHWIIKMVEYLNAGVLPAGFRARPTEALVGIEPDVLLLQQEDSPPDVRESQPDLAEATLTVTIAPPADLPVVGIYSTYGAGRLVSVIELISPGNKDRPEAVQAFVEKVAFLLQDGVHVMVIDVLSLPRLAIRPALLNRLGVDGRTNGEEGFWLSSYCSVPGDAPTPHIEVREWGKPATVGKPLPELPLFLHKDQLFVWVDLELTYSTTLSAGRYEPE